MATTPAGAAGELLTQARIARRRPSGGRGPRPPSEAFHGSDSDLGFTLELTEARHRARSPGGRSADRERRAGSAHLHPAESWRGSGRGGQRVATGSSCWPRWPVDGRVRYRILRLPTAWLPTVLSRRATCGALVCWPNDSGTCPSTGRGPPGHRPGNPGRCAGRRLRVGGHPRRAIPGGLGASRTTPSRQPRSRRLRGGDGVRPARR